MAEDIKNERLKESAEAAPADIKSLEPQDQTFWEDSVDASSVDLSEEETTQEGAKKEGEADSSPNTFSPPEGEGKGEGEDQPSEQEPLAAQEAGQEETRTDREGEEPQGKGKVISFHEYPGRKRLLTGIGILLLVAGSIGYAVVPGLRSPGTITSTLFEATPESAYNMKFFLPLNVGYEKAQFVKVTITLELTDQGLQKELDKNLSHLRKEVIDLILTKSPKEIRSTDGKRELSREITRMINNYLSKDCIKDTYFTELVIL